MAGLTHRIATSTLSAETRTEIIQILSGIDLDDDDFQDRLNEVEDAIIEAEENQTVNDDASEAAPGTPPFDGSPASRPVDAQDHLFDQSVVDQQEEKELPSTSQTIASRTRYYYFHRQSGRMEWSSYATIEPRMQELTHAHINSSIKEASKYANRNTNPISSQHIFNQVRSLTNYITCPIVKAISVHASRGYPGYISHSLQELSLNPLSCLAVNLNTYTYVQQALAGLLDSLAKGDSGSSISSFTSTFMTIPLSDPLAYTRRLQSIIDAKQLQLGGAPKPSQLINRFYAVKFNHKEQTATEFMENLSNTREELNFISSHSCDLSKHCVDLTIGVRPIGFYRSGFIDTLSYRLTEIFEHIIDL